MNIPSDFGDRIRTIVESLPVLTTKDIPDSEDSCPICLTPFSSLFLDTNLGGGVTKLVACNHIFCRNDLLQWIQSLHGNCPTCRHTFLDIRPPSESDDESSDGGEYIPDEDFEEDDDIFMGTDGFSDAIDYPQDMETEWEDSGTDADADMEDTGHEIDDDAEWGLTDGESSNMSEGADDSLVLESESMGGDVDIQVGLTSPVQVADGEIDEDILNQSGQEK